MVRRPRQESAHVLAGRDVSRHGEHCVTAGLQIRCRSCRRLGVNVIDNDAGTTRGKPPRHGVPHTSRGARYNGDFPCKLFCCICHLVLPVMFRKPLVDGYGLGLSIRIVTPMSMYLLRRAGS